MYVNLKRTRATFFPTNYFKYIICLVYYGDLCFGNLVRKPSDFLVVLFLHPVFFIWEVWPTSWLQCHRPPTDPPPPRVCHRPCMFQSCLFSGWTMGVMGCLLFRVVELKRLFYQIALERDTSACQANEARRTRRSVFFFFFWGTKAFCVDLLLENVLPFENKVEGKSCVIGFEMLWLIFFFLLNFIDSLFSVIGGNAPQSFNPTVARWKRVVDSDFIDALNASQIWFLLKLRFDNSHNQHEAGTPGLRNRICSVLRFWFKVQELQRTAQPQRLNQSWQYYSVPAKAGYETAPPAFQPDPKLGSSFFRVRLHTPCMLTVNRLRKSHVIVTRGRHWWLDLFFMIKKKKE